MLGRGDSVPDVQVWTAPREVARPLKQVLGANQIAALNVAPVALADVAK